MTSAATVIEVFHLAATLFRSNMKKTVDASIIAVAIQNETPTMSVSSSVASAETVVRPSIPSVNTPSNGALIFKLLL